MAPASAQSFTPSLLQAPPAALVPTLSAGSDSIVLQLVAMMFEREEKLRAEMQVAIAEISSTAVPQEEAINEEQLTTLQVRLAKLHAAELLTEGELHACEDMLADFVELKMSVRGRVITQDMILASAGHHTLFGVASKVEMLCVLSASMVSDAALARACRRKVLE
jgi:hypothetical protein